MANKVVIGDFSDGTLGASLPANWASASQFGILETFLYGGELDSATYAAGRSGDLCLKLQSTGVGYRDLDFYQDSTHNALVAGMGCTFKPILGRSCIQFWWYQAGGYAEPFIEFLFNDPFHLARGNLLIDTFNAPAQPENLYYTVDLNQWFTVELADDGGWSLVGDSAGVIGTGNLGVTTQGRGDIPWIFYAIALSDGATGGAPGHPTAILVDEVYVLTTLTGQPLFRRRNFE
ncbi:hypothetical protein GCM10028801_31080 [Nocardioides maradonensis]